jgi:hypothetical protein
LFKLKTLSSSAVKKNWQGFLVLDRLWKKGFFPGDFKRHYILHWFVVYNGNIIRTAQALQIHRNTIQGHFFELGYGKKFIRLRHAWQIYLKESKQSFEKRFYRFYRQFSPKSKFSSSESARLLALWQSSFPYKILKHHYLLWALRNKKTKVWIQSHLGYSHRHQARLLGQIVKSKSAQAFWLSPLKPKLSEIYSRGYKS